MIFRAKDKYFDLSEKPLIMGILNITPDSFSDGGKFNNIENAIVQCEKMITEGADIIDVGGESSRPGSIRISEEEELERILPVVKAIRSRFDICVSVDTYKQKVAEAVLEEGVHIINNIFGTDSDKALLEIIGRYSAGLCIMHTRGTPDIMQNDTVYEDIIAEIKMKLASSIEAATKYGVSRESIMIDPGIGFGKDIDGNIRIINELEEFKDMNVPVLIGTSRKSFIGKILGADENNRLYGTVSANVLALTKGAKIFRVHDIKENKSAIDLAYRILNA